FFFGCACTGCLASAKVLLCLEPKASDDDDDYYII
ncbi:hypothetical protein A2U01_0055312, partial [Trifolium medium]|nr:hypothetical protein [Trifolium medium]